MVRLVTEGYSWSGQERNVAFLNTRDGRFANVSQISQTNFKDDGRALGIVDWDQDGSLDLWYRNRTAPRLRVMRNRGNSRASVSLRLRSTTGNRDAIGAVVDLQTDQGHLLRSVRAGDLFLSQSSKWLHFGLAEQVSHKVSVLWPGGNREIFSGIAAGGRYELLQGTGRAMLIPTRSQKISLAPVRNVSASSAKFSARVWLPLRIPMPPISYRDSALASKSMVAGDTVQLLVLWSSQCVQCQSDMPKLLTKSVPGVELLALCVDDITDSAEAYALIDALPLPVNWGFVDGDALDQLQLLQHALFDKALPLTVPFALLLDPDRHALALYRGDLDLSVIGADAKTLIRTDAEALHHLAPPFPGTWFTNPVPMSYVTESLGRAFLERFPDTALPYLHLAATQNQGEKRTQLIQELASRHRALAMQFQAKNKPNEAGKHFERALTYAPESAALHHDFGVLLGSHQQLEKAKQQFELALKFDPQSRPSREALRIVTEALSAR